MSQVAEEQEDRKIGLEIRVSYMVENIKHKRVGAFKKY